MIYTLSLTRPSAETLHAHLLGDRSREQMAITLCGVNRLHRELRLLVRDVILLPPDAFRHQSAGGLELKPEVQAFIHARAHRHGLIEVDWHSHPGNGTFLGFSPTDDRYEAAQAAWLADRMAGAPYGSVVVNDDALDGRLWLMPAAYRAAADARPTASATAAGDAGRPADRPHAARTPPKTSRPRAYSLAAILAGDLARHIPLSTQRATRSAVAFVSPIFDRQVAAFGADFQRKLGGLKVGVIGVGGLGSAVVAHLGRLGVRDWVLVDPDVVELSNLNRLVNATTMDAQKARPKVNVARSALRQANPKTSVLALQADVFDPAAQHALKACDLLIVASDNHSSRLAANRLAVQYLIPLVHLGCNISVDLSPSPSPARGGEFASPLPCEGRGVGGVRSVTDVSGEYAIPDLGRWCLHCAGLVDPQAAGWELASPAQRAILRQRGYVADTPAPAVSHLDGVVAALAAAEIHNLVHAFKPQHRYLAYDALKAELIPLQVTPAAGCPVCSPDDGVLGLGDLVPLPDYRRSARVQLPPPTFAASLPHGQGKEALPSGAASGGQPVPAPAGAPADSSQEEPTAGAAGQARQIAAPLPAPPPISPTPGRLPAPPPALPGRSGADADGEDWPE